jgi:hypothetical protein
MTRFLESLARITPATYLLRGLAFVFTLVAALYAIPAVVFQPRLIALAAVGALLVAALPGTRIVTAVLAAAVFGWVLGWMGHLQDLTPAQVIIFGSALFLAHSSATLAAVVPADAVVSPEVLFRWYGRAFAIVAASAVLALILILGASLIAGFNGTFVASLVGLAAAVALVIALVRLIRR